MVTSVILSCRCNILPYFHACHILLQIDMADNECHFTTGMQLYQLQIKPRKEIHSGLFPDEFHHLAPSVNFVLRWKLFGCAVLVVWNVCFFCLPSGKGWYMYIETSYPRKPNDTAGLVSPTIKKPGSSACVLFWYHMFGPHVNALNVYMKVGN